MTTCAPVTTPVYPAKLGRRPCRDDRLGGIPLNEVKGIFPPPSRKGPTMTMVEATIPNEDYVLNETLTLDVVFDDVVGRDDDWTLSYAEGKWATAALRQEAEYLAFLQTSSGETWFGSMTPSGFGAKEPRPVATYRRKDKPMPDDVVVTKIDSVDPDELRSKSIGQFASKMRDNENPVYSDFVAAAGTTLPSEEDFWNDGVWQNEDFVLDTFGSLDYVHPIEA